MRWRSCGLVCHRPTHIGFYQSAGIISVQSPGTFAAATNVAAASGDSTSYASPTAYAAGLDQFGAKVTITNTYQLVSATSFAALQASVANLSSLQNNIALLEAPYTQNFGLIGTATSIATSATAGTFIYSDPLGATVPISSLTINAKVAGTVKLKNFSLSSDGSTFTEVANMLVTIPVTGIQTIAISGFSIPEGNYLGFYHNGPVATTANVNGLYGTGMKFAATGDQTTLTSFVSIYSASAPNVFSISFSASGNTQVVTAGAFSALQAGAISSPLITPTKTLYAYGDSMTQGTGGTPYPTQLTNLLNRTVNNRGVGAQTAPDIFGRWGSFPITVPGMTIPATGTVNFNVPLAFNVSNPLTQVNSTVTFTGTLAGVPGTLSYVGFNGPTFTYQFARTTSGNAVTVIPNTCFFLDDSEGRKFSTVILWVGRNSIGLQDTTNSSAADQFNYVMEWNERAVNYLKSVDRHFIIMGPANRSDEYRGSTTTVSGAALTGDQAYSVIVQIENEMRQRWPMNFVNQRGHVVASYNSTDATDTADFLADRTPTSLRYDFLHYNTAGYAIVAQQVYNRIQLLGY